MTDPLRNAKNVTIRMHEDEHRAMLEACEALSGSTSRVEPSLLLTTAAVEEASRLGFTPSTAGAQGRAVRRKPRTWENAPPPNEESFKRRITITVHPLHFHVILSAARWAEAEVPRFIVGSMWRFIANRQRFEPRNARLQAIALPWKYLA